MRGGPRGFRPGFPCPVVLRFLSRKATHFRLRGLYPLWRRVPPALASTSLCNFPTALRHDQDRSYNPGSETPAGCRADLGLGSSRFARHYSGNRCFFLFLRLLRCFSSPAYLLPPYVFRWWYPRITTGGFPHSEIPGSTLDQQLPEAYRSRPRPSSAPGAKASTVCPCSLDSYSREHHKTALEFSRCTRARVPAASRERTTPARGPAMAVSQNSTVWAPPPEGDGRHRVSTYSRLSRSTGRHECHRTVSGARGQDKPAAFPRKEVIQPQLPLRLPCYDFTPITDSTFGRCLPCGLAHGLRVFPAFVV